MSKSAYLIVAVADFIEKLRKSVKIESLHLVQAMVFPHLGILGTW